MALFFWNDTIIKHIVVWIVLIVWIVWIRGCNTIDGVVGFGVHAEIEPNSCRSFFLGPLPGCLGHRVADLSQLLHDVRHVHAFMPVCEHDGAEQDAIPAQHVGMRRIGHDETFAWHHEDAVEHGHQSPHVRVVAVHLAKILIQPKCPIDAIRKMIQYFSVVSSNRVHQRFIIVGSKHGLENVLKVFIAGNVEYVNVFLVHCAREMFDLFYGERGC